MSVFISSQNVIADPASFRVEMDKLKNKIMGLNIQVCGVKGKSKTNPEPSEDKEADDGQTLDESRCEVR